MGVINSVTKKFWLNFNPHPPPPSQIITTPLGHKDGIYAAQPAYILNKAKKD